MEADCQEAFCRWCRDFVKNCPTQLWRQRDVRAVPALAVHPQTGPLPVVSSDLHRMGVMFDSMAPAPAAAQQPSEKLVREPLDDKAADLNDGERFCYHGRCVEPTVV